eukprot:CAMPEP_0194763678 /NCGR_PEP_ID=MMETSP0323_2-20130528/20289_1 /TAXON_ID=2866 ORGANISM="Crypthecodinium cohnii, Strain Seligo" /NCGR_SAMPLE_ID=MMETSP0323_2 /ASSEMBLY_ACC=CAM_ASM_000346 /LENGTH=40 /DNA_ID= /DNA_START= /DNA_END= /DNA_ORIENTATION=
MHQCPCTEGSPHRQLVKLGLSTKDGTKRQIQLSLGRDAGD